MSNWKVSKEIIEIFPHGNAEALDIARVGDNQLVVRKDTYKTGDVVLFIPEKSILKNENLRLEFAKYLTGSGSNRVRGMQLRGEVSQGITFPLSEIENAYDARISDLVEAAPIGEDISELLNIEKYEPPIPRELSGMVKGIVFNGEKGEVSVDLHRHDCYQFGFLSKEFDPEETVVITEKVHGSQINYALHIDGDTITEVVTSKGLLGRGLQILEDGVNFYWKAVRNSEIKEKAYKFYREQVGTDIGPVTIHVIGEVVPVQAGFSYGFTEPTFLVYDVVVNNVLHIGPFSGVVESDVPAIELFPFVPVLYHGPLKDVDVYEICKGKETVSGKELHIREGVVVTPLKPRKSSKGVWLFAKVINPKYAAKETGDEVN